MSGRKTKLRRRVHKREWFSKIKEDRKISDRCYRCNCLLPRYSKHHTLCHKCWVAANYAIGNSMLIGGVKPMQIDARIEAADQKQQ